MQSGITERDLTQSPTSDRRVQSIKEPSTSFQSNNADRSNNANWQEKVRRRAYEIYEQRGMSAGSEIEDWLQAEAEIMDGERRRKAA